MKTIEIIRHENTQTLRSRYKSLAEFSEVLGRSSTQISRLIGRNPTKSIGSVLARQIEEKTGTEYGWLDIDHSKKEEGTEQNANNSLPPIHMVPIIEWHQASEYCGSSQPGMNEDSMLIACPVIEASERTFALRVIGDSMMKTHGRTYPPATIIYVDPTRKAKVGMRVLADTGKGHTFKELVENEFGEKQLSPLNPSHNIITDENFKVVGVVIGSFNFERE